MMLMDFTKEQFDIVIQAGQSNSDGTGFGGASKPYQPKDTVWYLQSEDPQGKKQFDDLTMSIAREAVRDNLIQSNYSFSFADAYLEAGLLKPGRKLLILRASVGGTGFSDKRWGMTDDLYLRMTEMLRTALSLNPGNRPVAFLWHQGETDALGNLGYVQYTRNISELLGSVRSTFGCPELPFVCGDFVKQWKDLNAAICEPILSALRDFCAATPGCAFVETFELPSNDESGSLPTDTIHFCRESLYRLGRKYFEAYRKLAGV